MLSNVALLDLGTPELIIILLIVLLLFGSKKLPELSKSIGESIKTLRKSLDDNEKVAKKTTKESAK